MKQLLTLLLLLCSLTISSQTKIITGTKNKQQQAAAKPKQQAAPKQQTATKPKQQQAAPKQQTAAKTKQQAAKPKQQTAVAKPTRSPQKLRTESFTVNGVSFKMCYVKGGTFLMGATSEQGSDAFDNEKPLHRVTLSDYYIGQTEVTQALWQAVMGTNPSEWKGDNLPVENVSWDDCQTFIEKLNAKTGRTFRLPTEAEWEFAARGGNNSRDYKFSGSNNLEDVAWYDGNSNDKTHTVATKQANELGIYDMSGNVCEWCQDWYGNYSSSIQTNPTGPNSGSFRVYRGGSWGDNARFCRVSDRDDYPPSCTDNYLGLRLILLP